MLDLNKVQESFSNLSVAVVGVPCLDINYIGRYNGFSREAEELPIFRANQVTYNLGGPANLAGNLKALGIRTVILMGTCGNRVRDIAYSKLRHLIGQIDVQIDWVVDGRTPVFIKEYFPSGKHIGRKDLVSSPLSKSAERSLVVRLERILREVDCVVFADYDETGNGLVTESILGAIWDSGKPRFATSRTRLRNFQGYGYLVMNERELREQFGGTGNQTYSKQGMLSKAFAATGSKHIVVTMADQGAEVWEPGPQLAARVPAFPIQNQQIDSCGCGDMFLAAFSACTIAGVPAAKSIALANSAARVVATKLYGVGQPPTWDEISDSYDLYKSPTLHRKEKVVPIGEETSALHGWFEEIRKM